MESADNPKIERIIEDPIGDDDIRAYLPDSKIMKYSELARYKTIEDLLPEPVDYAFLLYEDSPNKGHWVCVSRYGKTIEFFDSYGGAPDTQLGWVSCPRRRSLGQGRPMLTDLFNKSKASIVYNPIKYQGESDDINTCGRHCLFRIINLTKAQRRLEDYYKTMRELEEDYKEPYDTIVANIIKR
jgi:hypothetical protein